MDFNLPIWQNDFMQDENKEIAVRIRAIRIAKKLKQSELDEMAGLPSTTICKIEKGNREVTANHLIQIAKALRVTVDSLLNNEEEFVFKPEVRIIQALREVAFEDYQRFIERLEGDLYYAAKQADPERKEYLDKIVRDLIGMSKQDVRARTTLTDVKRVRKQWRNDV